MYINLSSGTAAHHSINSARTHQHGEMKTTWSILVWVAPIIGLDISQKYWHWLSATLQNKYPLPKIMI